MQYQPLDSDKLKTVKGVDTPSGTDTGAWDWRGKGWLMIASSHWEVLAWGPQEGEVRDEAWAVTYFAKTPFTPEGIDIYSRKKEGVSDEVVDAIKEALGGVQNNDFKKLAGEIFEVKQD